MTEIMGAGGKKESVVYSNEPDELPGCEAARLRRVSRDNYNRAAYEDLSYSAGSLKTHPL